MLYTVILTHTITGSVHSCIKSWVWNVWNAMKLEIHARNQKRMTETLLITFQQYVHILNIMFTYMY